MASNRVHLFESITLGMPLVVLSYFWNTSSHYLEQENESLGIQSCFISLVDATMHPPY